MQVVIETPRKEVVNRLETDGWRQGDWGDEDGPKCLHGAIRLCCPEPGDAFLIEKVADRFHRGTGWNDVRGRTFEQVKESLLSETLWDITDLDLEATFGPNWEKVVEIVRQAAAMTPEQAEKLAAAWDATWDAAWNAAWDAARDAAWAAARDADAAARDAAAAAWDAARDAARDAALAAVVVDLVGQHGLEQRHIETLMGPWNRVFGEEESC